jgi:hypothetical protein
MQSMTIATMAIFSEDWKYLSTLVGFILTIAGLSFTGYNLWRNGRSQRAAMMLNMIDHYLSDVDMRDLYYRIHYGQFSNFLDEVTLPDGSVGRELKADPASRKDERSLGKLLYTFDAIGRLVKFGVLSVDEVNMIAFQAIVVLRNAEVQEYLSWQTTEYERFGRPTPAHKDALDLADMMEAYAKRWRKEHGLKT